MFKNTSTASTPTDTAVLTNSYPAVKMQWLSLVVALLLHSPHIQAQWDVDYKYSMEDYKDDRQSCPWRCMVFTQQWPGSFCQFLQEESLCKIPPFVNNWTIHGLWPKNAHKCCHCWPLFHSDIKDVEQSLAELWPSFITIKTDFQFWQSEWSKHGVCAACVKALNSPLKYFSTCLKLRARFDVDRLFADAGIVPSNEHTYEVEQLRKVVFPLFGDHHEIQCFKDKQGRELLFQLKVSLFSNGTTGCGHADLRSDRGPNITHPCPSDVPLFILPINHDLNQV